MTDLADLETLSAVPVTATSGAAPPAPASDAGHLVRSLFGFGVTQLVSWVAGAALLVLVPRFLGDVSLGKLGFAVSLTGMCGLISDPGISYVVVKEVARAPARAGELVAAAALLSVLLNVVAVAGVIGILVAGGYDTTTREVVLVLAISMVATGVGRAVRAGLQGLHRMRTIAVVPVVAGYANAGGVIAVLAAGGGVVLVAIVGLLSYLIGLGVSAVELLRRVRARARPRWRTCRLLLAGGLPFLVGEAALVVYGQIDTVLLSFFAGDAVIGWYSAALRLISAAQFLPAMLVTVTYPMLSAAAADPRRFNAVVQRAFALILLVNLPIAVGIALLPDRIIHMLGYPAGFDNSVVPLVLLAAGTPMIALDMVIAVALGAADRQRQWAIMGVAAAVINVLANLVAIPLTERVYHNGAIGAAATTTLTELFLLVTGIALLPRGVVGRGTLARALRCVGASTLMTAAIVPLREAPLVLPIVAGALTLVSASYLLGAVSRDEIRFVVRQIAERRGARRRPSVGSP